MTIPKLSNLPEIPERLPPSPTPQEAKEFNEKLDCFFASIPAYVEQANGIIDCFNEVQDRVVKRRELKQREVHDDLLL